MSCALLSLRVRQQPPTFGAPKLLLLTAPELAGYVTSVWGADYPQPARERYPETAHRLLLTLGVADEPALARVR